MLNITSIVPFSDAGASVWSPRWPPVCGAGHCDQVVRLKHLYYNFSNTGHCRRHRRCRCCKLHVAMEPGAAGAWAGDPGHLFGLCTVDPIKTDHSRHHTHNLLCCILFLFHSLHTVSHIVSRARLRLFLIDTTSYDLCTLMLQSLPILSVDSKFIWNKHWCCWSHCYCMSHIKQSYLKWNCSTSNEYAAAAGSSLSPHWARVWCRVCIVQLSVPCSVRYRWHVVIEFRHMIDQTFCCSLLKLLSSYI